MLRRSSAISVLFALLATTGLVAASPASAQQTGGRPEPRRALESFTAKYVDAYNRKDAAAVAALYTDDAVLVQPSPNPVVTGKPNFERYWRAAFDAGRSDLRYDVQQVEAQGDAVWAVGRFTVMGPPPGQQTGQVQQNHGVFVNIYEWSPGGELRFRVHSFALLPGGQPPR